VNDDHPKDESNRDQRDVLDSLKQKHLLGRLFADVVTDIGWLERHPFPRWIAM
jgi:hypothetical protein